MMALGRNPPLSLFGKACKLRMTFIYFFLGKEKEEDAGRGRVGEGEGEAAAIRKILRVPQNLKYLLSGHL